MADLMKDYETKNQALEAAKDKMERLTKQVMADAVKLNSWRNVFITNYSSIHAPDDVTEVPIKWLGPDKLANPLEGYRKALSDAKTAYLLLSDDQKAKVPAPIP